MFKIEKNFPIPESGVGRPVKYPFGIMDVGDSFFVPKPNRISSAASHFGKRNNKKFRSLPVVEDGIEGTRVWRIE